MSIVEKFKSDEIFKDVLDEVNDLSELKVEYLSGFKASGVELTPTNVKDEPSIDWDADENSFYTLLLTDPDAPNRTEPKFREVRHWLVVNIPGKDIKQGETKWAYIGSGPPQGSGLHRYIFLVFKQNKGKQDYSDMPNVSNKSRDGRLSTNTRKLIADYDLRPVSGNFYFAQFDDYVPILHAQLGGAPPKA